MEPTGPNGISIIKWTKVVHIQANTFVCMKSSIRKTLATREKLCPRLSLLINIRLRYKWNGLIGWLFYSAPKKLVNGNHYTNEWDCYPICNHVINKTPPKVDCFSPSLMTMSVLLHVYCYPLLGSGMKTGLWTITLCRKDIVLLHEQKGQGIISKMIIDILQAMVSRLLIYYSP